MAHTKSKGSTRLGRDSASKRLGIKRQHSQSVKIGEILVRQRGSQYLAGENVGCGKDDTLYALKTGVVNFISRKKKRFDGNTRNVKVVSVIPTQS